MIKRIQLIQASIKLKKTGEFIVAIAMTNRSVFKEDLLPSAMQSTVVTLPEFTEVQVIVRVPKRSGPPTEWTARQDGASDGDSSNPKDENKHTIKLLVDMQQADPVHNDQTRDGDATDSGADRNAREPKRFDTLMVKPSGTNIIKRLHGSRHATFAILFSGLRRSGIVDDIAKDMDWLAEYRKFASMPSVPSPHPYQVIMPKAFVSRFTWGHLIPNNAYWVLPVIIKMICLRRDMGGPVDYADNEDRLIGDDIPPNAHHVRDLRHPGRVRRKHNLRFMQLLTEMERTTRGTLTGA
ncbi:hypothetical protein CNMCM7691_002056 [Aspergillus felis]|uniref:Uncharacterized protein n=1 Tax=Aspergillus felis TaxID=1287682 RepID=A0A8H6R0G5_9EURO|nr:hypothetical protein CNMCM7691_002056 [Aspergillus felis]